MTQPIKIGKKLLVADDEPHILRTLDDLLTAEGYIIFKATDGKKALEQAESAFPDLIILDVMMPKMDGFEVLKRLKKNPRTMDIPVIMLTVKSTSHDIEEGIKLYAEKYITKPFSSDALLQEIEKSLSIRDKNAGGPEA